MASNSADDDGFVLLKCVDPQRTEPETVREEVVISTAEINSWDLLSILSHQNIKVKANRYRLIEQASYFHGLLSGSFRESCLDCISIRWNLETFLSVLRSIFGCPIEVTPANFLLLYEAALFFGVEMLLLKCNIWLTKATSSKGCWSMQLQLNDLIHIWKFALEHGNDFILELCMSYLARNFMWAMSSYSFSDVPCDLLLSCIKHSHLTVDSEKHLCKAVLVWIAANTEQSERSSSAEDDCTDILRQLRTSLLPLWFAAGKKRCRYFSKLADRSIDAILALVRDSSTSSMNVFAEDGGLRHLKIRLTEYSEKLDLSGCPQMKPLILLLSMLPSSYSIDPSLRKSIKQCTANLEHIDGDRFHISWGIWPTLTFEAVQEVDISNCPMLHLEAAIECFCKSFPSLSILKAAYFSNFKTRKLCQLVQRCPLLCVLDLTVDISPLIPTQVSIISSCPDIRPQTSRVYFDIGYYAPATPVSFMSKPQFSSITKLILEGRTDVSDFDLQTISELCAFLSHLNLNGCISVTDAGISVIIQKCIKLCSIMVCYTSFGQNSILALCSTISNYDHGASPQIEKKHSQSLIYNLQTLHMGGCKGVSETSISEFLSRTHTLKSLCLRETNLVDNALYSFFGSSLELLDVSDTKVSGSALAHIIHRNPALKCLKARGCRNLFQQDSKVEGEFPTSLSTCKELYIELGNSCKLEEIAFGWGFSYFSMEALKPATATLRAITIGLGGSLGQDGLKLLPTTCPLLESVILYFQVISDPIIINLTESLRHLQVLALCYCFGEISSLSFKFGIPNLRKLRLERVAPWMTNDDLVILTQNCTNLIELSLLGCRLLNPESQDIISSGWPGLISIHLEDCGVVTENGVASLFDCQALEDLLLRHNGPGIYRKFIVDAASKMPMLRKLSLDLCDARDGDFDIPNVTDTYFLSTVKISRCKLRRCTLDLQKSEARRTSVHKETLVLVWDSKNLTRTVVKERV